MSPFEAMYGRKCNTPVSWDNPIEKVIIGIELLKDTKDLMVMINQNIKVAQDRKKIYADQNMIAR